MKFSICIPNFNYAQYIGATVRSALLQSHRDLEVVISDNASTDDSVAVIQSIDDPRIRFRINHCNVGFSRNLDRAAEMATGTIMLMVSSDDLILSDALDTYRKLYETLGVAASDAVVCSSSHVIDAVGKVIGRGGPDPELWRLADLCPQLSEWTGANTYQIAAPDLLQRSMRRMRNPFNFAATAYPRELYARIEGYGGGRLINPDKWFNWRLLSVAKTAFFIDRPLFAYRVHSNNQTSQQANAGDLRYMVDDYVSTLQVTPHLLKQAGMKQTDVISAFVEHNVARHGLATLAKGDAQRARRILDFGKAVYPSVMRGNAKVYALAAFLAMRGPGTKIAGRLAKHYYRAKVC